MFTAIKHRALDWRVGLAAAVGSAALLAACGGGSSSSSSSEMAAAAAPAVTASYAQGPVSGFGSVIVGGVRYDDSSASVTDEDGNARSASELGLGTMVQVDAVRLDLAAGTAMAQRFRIGSELVGPVGAVDTAASTVQVLGQTVRVTTSTVFETTLSGGLAALSAGAVVEVHGIADATSGQITATRIESRTGATAFRVRGAVAALDSTARTFMIGNALISYAGLAAANVPSSLANGAVVRAALQTTPQAGAWVATAVRSGQRMPGAVRDAHVEGAITALTSSASFELNGLKVDASTATFPDGTGGIVVGARVEVTGTVSNGVLVATKVEIADKRGSGQRPFELHGAIGGLDASAKTFALRGVTVWYGGSVSYGNGTAADLANGGTVDIQGVLSADRTRLQAQRIAFRT